MKETLVIAALLLSTPAWAGHKPAPTPDPETLLEQSQAQRQGQQQGQQQAAIAAAGAASSADAEATSVANGGRAVGIGGAGGNSGGNTLSTAYESRDRAIALALPGQTGAPAVTGECLEHLRGGSGASIGVSGRTRINRECMQFVQCVAIADRYAAWGQLRLAVEQLERCGGVRARELELPATLAAERDYVTREELERVFEASLAK